MSRLRAIGSLAALPLEYCLDAFQAFRWSKASPLSPRQSRMFYDIILLAHTVEKGLAQPRPRLGFGQAKISALLALLENYQPDWDPFPVEMSYGALSAYLRVHSDSLVDVGSIGPRIKAFVDACHERLLTPRGGTKTVNWSGPAAAGEVPAADILSSRVSCRRFLNQVVARDTVLKAVSLAQRAPSQCNRQATKIYCYQDEARIKALLDLQRGAAGFGNDVKNLFVVASDMSAWSGQGARNQAFVDGSLFAMNLSLACQILGIGSCPLNLAVGNLRERKIRIAGGIPCGERLIMMMAFGYPDTHTPLVVAKSERIPVESVVRFL